MEFQELLKVVGPDTKIALHHKVFGIGFVSEHYAEYFLKNADNSILISEVIDVYASDDEIHVVTDK